MQFVTHAAFMIDGRWVWKTFTSGHANKHAAISSYGAQIGATAWDMGSADHDEGDRTSHTPDDCIRACVRFVEKPGTYGTLCKHCDEIRAAHQEAW